MNDLAAYDFWGNCTWVGGDDMARCERLRLYEKYRLAELRYEEEIAKLKRERDAITKDFRMVVHSAINTLGINARCRTCKHLHDICEDCHWEWRGVCEENTEVNPDEKV